MAKNSANGIVAINVGGTLIQCYRPILNAFPESKLASIEKFGVLKSPTRPVYFFDRNPLLFGFILDGCRSKRIHLPKGVCGTTLKEEMAFWRISPKHVAPCCFEILYKSEDDVEIVEKITTNIMKNKGIIDLKSDGGIKQKLWLFLDEPRSSTLALIWCIFLSTLIVAAAALEALATIPYFQVETDPDEHERLRRVTFEAGWSNETSERFASRKHHPIIEYSDLAFHVIFTIEFFVGAFVCPNKARYWKSYVRILLLIAYAAYWADAILEHNFYHVDSIHLVRLYLTFKYLTILMLMRLFYVARHLPSFNLIGLTFRQSKQELAILGLTLLILMLIFGFIFFVSERLYNPDMHNVFTGIYWALITVTTVGYGRYIPVTTVGHFIASACAVCGVIILALPIGIMASTFYSYYNFHRFARKHAAICIADLEVTRGNTRITRVKPAQINSVGEGKLHLESI